MIFQMESCFQRESFRGLVAVHYGSYFVSATSSHYNWAMKKIRKFKKVIINYEQLSIPVC